MKAVFLLFIYLFSSLTLSAEAEKYVKLKAKTNKLNVKQGDEFKITVNMQLDKSWYTYSLEEQIGPEGIGPTPTEILVAPEDVIEISKEIVPPPTKRKFDEGFEFEIDYYKGSVNFDIYAKAKKDINFKKDTANVLVYIQLCDTVKCLPPEELAVRIMPVVTESLLEYEEKKSEGFFTFIFWAMGLGALALLTPCVFPMIPITVSFFTKRSEKSRTKGIRDALIYSLSIVFFFTLIGFLFSVVSGAGGAQSFASNGWVNLMIAALFIIFAFNLFGSFEIQVPTSILNKLNAKTTGSGITSIFLMAIVFTLTSFTCTVPLVGTTLLTYSQGEWFYPTLAMLAFAAVFATPFFFLAVFPSLMNKLPKSGGWLNNVKVVMGFVEIAAAVKFISTADLYWKWGVLPREIYLSIWIACGVLVVLYILGFYKLKLDSDVDRVSGVRAMFAVVFAAITIYFIPGLFGNSLGEIEAFLPPSDYEQIISLSRQGDAAATLLPAAASTGTSSVKTTGRSRNRNLVMLEAQKGEEGWIRTYNDGLKIAKEENRNIFIDFTGFACTNCRQMETSMFPKPEIAGLLDQYVKVKLYTDYEENKILQESRFGSVELPLYVILTPEEDVIATNSFTRDVNSFRQFLEMGVE